MAAAAARWRRQVCPAEGKGRATTSGPGVREATGGATRRDAFTRAAAAAVAAAAAAAAGAAGGDKARLG